MGEVRLHVVFGTGQAGSSLRNWPGWVSRSGRCPGAGPVGYGRAGAEPAPREKEKGHGSY